MLLDAELDDYVADPGSFADGRSGERLEGYRALFELEPPFIIADDAAADVAVAARARGRRRPRPRRAPCSAGWAAAHGTYTGPARVVKDLAAAAALEPGEVLVAPLTDAAWTPLFLVAGAVVVDVGALNSHAVVVCREVGLPCVLSVTGRARRCSPTACCSPSTAPRARCGSTPCPRGPRRDRGRDRLALPGRPVRRRRVADAVGDGAHRGARGGDRGGHGHGALGRRLRRRRRGRRRARRLPRLVGDPGARSAPGSCGSSPTASTRAPTSWPRSMAREVGTPIADLGPGPGRPGRVRLPVDGRRGRAASRSRSASAARWCYACPPASSGPSRRGTTRSTSWPPRSPRPWRPGARSWSSPAASRPWRPSPWPTSRTRSGCRPGCSTSSPAAAREAGEVLVQHPEVDLVSLTGSTEAGARVAALAARGDQARDPRARRQVGVRPLPGRRPGRGRRRRRADGVRQQRPDLLGDHPARRRPRAAGRGRGPARRARAAPWSSATRSTRRRRSARWPPGRSTAPSRATSTTRPGEGTVLVGGPGLAADRDRGWFVRPTVVSRLDNGCPHRAGGDLRPGARGHPGRRRGRGGRASPTTPTTGCPERSGPATSRAPWPSPGGCAPGRCRSTAAGSTCSRRSAASRSPASAASSARTGWPSTSSWCRCSCRPTHRDDDRPDRAMTAPRNGRRALPAPARRPGHPRSAARLRRERRGARLRRPVGAGAHVLPARACLRVRRPPGPGGAGGLPHHALDPGDPVGRGRLVHRAGDRHQRAGRRLPPPGAAGAAAGHPRRPVGRPPGRRVQRRLVRRRAPAGRRRPPHARAAAGRDARRPGGLLGPGPGALRRRVLLHPDRRRAPQAAAEPAAAAAVGDALGRRAAAHRRAVRHLEPRLGRAGGHPGHGGPAPGAAAAGARAARDLLAGLHRAAGTRPRAAGAVGGRARRGRGPGPRAPASPRSSSTPTSTPRSTTPEAWAELPRRLAPLLAAAR